MPDTIKAYRCRHIHTTGNRCGSKSLREQNFCFYHKTTRKPGPKPEAPSANPAKEAFDLPFPEDRASIQLAIGEVLRRIAANAIDPRRAGLLLYGLQIASLNLPRQAAPRPEQRDETEDPVEEVETDPNHGPVAPIAEYTEEEDRRPLSTAGRLLRLLEEEDLNDADDHQPGDAVLGKPGNRNDHPCPVPTIAASLPDDPFRRTAP